METSVPKLQTFFVNEIVRKKTRKGETQFFKKEGILKKRGVKKRETGRSSELRKILSGKTYSIVM